MLDKIAAHERTKSAAHGFMTGNISSFRSDWTRLQQVELLAHTCPFDVLAGTVMLLHPFAEVEELEQLGIGEARAFAIL